MTRGIVQSFVPLVQVLFSLKFESREDKGIEWGLEGDFEQQLKSAHRLLLEQDGNIIVTDTENKLIMLFIPEGNF